MIGLLKLLLNVDEPPKRVGPLGFAIMAIFAAFAAFFWFHHPGAR